MKNVIINFTYPKQKICFTEGYILKGLNFRCNYTRFQTLYCNPGRGTETVQLYNFEPKSDIRASVLILHGLGSQNIKFLLWMGPHLASAGIHSTVLVLPGNYTRVDDHSVSGRSYVWPEMKTMYQFWEHAVVDVMSTIDLLQQRSIWKKNNCLIGYCLGGMISSIVSAMDRRINQTIFMTTGGHIPKILHESPVTKFARRLFETGLKDEYFLHDKKKLYDIYQLQLPSVKKMSLLEIQRSDSIHPLFRIDPLSYAHLLNKDKVTFIDALFDETLPLLSRTSLFKEMRGGIRYVLPMTHVSWLPFERFLAQYVLLKVNINDKKAAKQVLAKQQLDNIFDLLIGKMKI